MREILFRAQHVKTGEKVNLKGEPIPGVWVYGGLLQGSGDFSIIYSAEPEISKWPVYSDTIGQFTGLTDKNGKKIFEGDICRVDGILYKVAFNFSEWCYQIISNKVYCYPNFHSHVGEHCEVLGNIHDNPELLEEKA